MVKNNFELLILSISLKWEFSTLYLEKLVMLTKENPDNDGTDPSEEYFKRMIYSENQESEEYYPQEESIPPHY